MEWRGVIAEGVGGPERSWDDSAWVDTRFVLDGSACSVRGSGGVKFQRVHGKGGIGVF